MRKTIAIFVALAFATVSLPAFAAGPHQHAKKYIPSLTDLVTAYATQISSLGTATITTALSKIATPSTTFDAAGWSTKIAAANGTPTFIQTVVDAVNAAIAAHQAAVGPGYVVVTQSFIDAAMAAKQATR
jgi:hypothetical protein